MEDMICLSKDWVYLALVVIVASLITIGVIETYNWRSYRKLNVTVEDFSRKLSEFVRGQKV